MQKFKIKSFCKINLFLRVLRRLSNGYHSIKTLITFCEIHDVLFIQTINAKKDVITFGGKFKKNINKKNNTITKTLSLLRKAHLLKNQTFKINIIKNIPHGSGLGGGSSDAASLLTYINLKMQLKLNKKKIRKIASQVGYDVPINLEKKNTLITGKKGEIIRINKKFRLNLLIVYPNIICSTKKIYQKNKEVNLSSIKLPTNLDSEKKLIKFLQNERNDLESVVTQIHPQVKKVINYIKIQKGCYFSRISGSGSACIGIFSDMKNAIYAKKMVKLKYPKYWSATSKTI